MATNIKGGDTIISNTGLLRIVDDTNNTIDSTQGDWEIVGGESNLYVVNHKNNKKYKITLEEVS
tara:strand:- start:514 stop:705 length:192 start_codon:yes stop_codon:yes gene_type:complete